MVDYVSIPELTETITVDDPDFLIIRQGLVDRKVSISSFKDGLLPLASTSQQGIVQLSTATNSTSINTAATSSAVKAAYDLAQTAINDASDVADLLDTKANVSHTHDASAITSGTINVFRLPWANLSSHGVVRPTDNLSLSSASAYVPSIESVKTIRQDLDNIQLQIDALELGSAFMPLPETTVGNTSITEYPIGTCLLVNAGTGFIERSGNRGVRLCRVSTVDVAAKTAGAAGNGRFVVEGFTGAGIALNGVWVARGSYSPIFASGAFNITANSTTYAVQNCVLMQRIS